MCGYFKLNIISSILLVLFFAIPVHANENVKTILTPEQQTAYKRLENTASNLYTDWDDGYTIPDWIRLTDLDIIWRSDNYTERAYQFFDE